MGDLAPGGVNTGERARRSLPGRSAGKGFALRTGMGGDCIIAIPARSPDPAPPGPRQSARVIQLAAYRQRLPHTERDRILDAEWNRLAILVAEALSWRDPESVEAVGACVARLERLVRADWGAR